MENLIALDEKYYMNVFGHRFEKCFVSGKDMYLIDTQGNEYLDFLAGIAVNCLGYSDEGFKTAIKTQVDNLLHSSNYFYIETQAKAAQKLCELSGMDKAFFANSGAEAVEGAIKLARKYFYKKAQSKSEIITMRDSFHGRTLGTLSATGQECFQTPFAPLLPTFKHVPFNDLAAIEAAITPNTAAILLEPILGEGGVIPAKREFLVGVRQLCDARGILMIADEIQCGMGRTGYFMACDMYTVKPDIVTFAKALGNGIPIGAFAAREDIASAFEPADHGTTFGGNHLATAAALYVLTYIAQSDILNYVRETGIYFKAQLQKLLSPNIMEVRGEGLMLALVLNKSINPKEIILKLLDMGFVVGSAKGNCLRFVPPYIVTKQQIDSLCLALSQVL